MISVVADSGCEKEADKLAERMGLRRSLWCDAEQEELLLRQTSVRLELVLAGDKSTGPVYVDFVTGKAGHRFRFGGGRGQLVAKAVGIKKDFLPSVIDATAGLGRDAFVLASLGCKVRMLERSPVVAALLADGMARALADPEIAKVVTEYMQLEVANATEKLVSLAEDERPDDGVENLGVVEHFEAATQHVSHGVASPARIGGDRQPGNGAGGKGFR